MIESKPEPERVLCWTAHGAKHIECVVMRLATGSFDVRLERGVERESFWICRTRTATAAIAATELVKNRLLERGWVLGADRVQTASEELAEKPPVGTSIP